MLVYCTIQLIPTSLATLTTECWRHLTDAVVRNNGLIRKKMLQTKNNFWSMSTSWWWLCIRKLLNYQKSCCYHVLIMTGVVVHPGGVCRSAQMSCGATGHYALNQGTWTQARSYKVIIIIIIIIYLPMLWST